MSGRPDVLILGAGLAGGLIAAALAESRPEADILVLERGDAIGGNHTWCFHEGDLPPPEARLVAPFVAHRWPGQRVVFPAFARRLGTGYACVTAVRFAAVLGPRLGERIRFGAEAVEVTPTEVRLAGGETLRAGAVIDARGAMPSPRFSFGWQKFCGLELRLAEPAALSEPIIMDATVPQADGYRFAYVLPFAPDRLLVEATAYSDGPELPAASFAADARLYVERRRWRIAEVLREERGVLPITLAGDAAAFWAEAGGVPRAGLRAGLFHPATGYSLPEAARLAGLVAGTRDLSAPSLFAAIRGHALRRWREQAFYRALNRMLFLAAEPARRVAVLERFYRLPEPLISRFYAGASTPFDKARIVAGRPPVPVLPALGALMRRHPTGAAA